MPRLTLSLLTVLFTYRHMMALVVPTVEFSSSISGAPTVCDEAVTFNVTYINNTGSSLSSHTLDLGLPVGIEYVSGSLSETTSFGVAQSDVSDLQNPVFSCPSISSGDTVVFSVSILAKVPAIAHQQAGNVFRNYLTLTASGTPYNHTSPSYNVLYGALSFTGIVPYTTYIQGGSTSTRTVSLVNGGNGRISTLYITETSGANIQLESISIGTLNATKDTITLSGSDFNGVGNNDDYLDSNESISVVETLSALGCSSGTINTTFGMYWGCDAAQVTSSTATASARVTVQLPKLAISKVASISTCFNESSSTNYITLKNNGNGVATNMEVEIYKADNRT